MTRCQNVNYLWICNKNENHPEWTSLAARFYLGALRGTKPRLVNKTHLGGYLIWKRWILRRSTSKTQICKHFLAISNTRKKCKALARIKINDLSLCKSCNDTNRRNNTYFRRFIVYVWYAYNAWLSISRCTYLTISSRQYALQHLAPNFFWN